MDWLLFLLGMFAGGIGMFLFLAWLMGGGVDKRK